jgi:hypothetical protein
MILFVSPPGRIANWTNWTLLGLRKQEWIGLHVCFSLLFLVAALFHVFFNWRPMLNYFKDRLSRRLGFRWEWAAALLVCLVVLAGTRSNVPPFATLLAAGENIKEGWDRPQERAPLPHAELLTLAELAQKAGVDLATATNRLQQARITNASPEVIVQQLAQANRRSAREIYESLLASTSSREPARGGGHRAGAGGGPGGGPGRKTLKEFCADEGIELATALERLQSKGIKATSDLTLREIAVNNGFSRPYELLDIIRPK